MKFLFFILWMPAVGFATSHRCSRPVELEALPAVMRPFAREMSESDKRLVIQLRTYDPSARYFQLLHEYKVALTEEWGEARASDFLQRVLFRYMSPLDLPVRILRPLPALSDLGAQLRKGGDPELRLATFVKRRLEAVIGGLDPKVLPINLWAIRAKSINPAIFSQSGPMHPFTVGAFLVAASRGEVLEPSLALVRANAYDPIPDPHCSSGLYINGDPRGYTLRVSNATARELLNVTQEMLDFEE